MSRLQVLARNLLLAFVLITIGFALGKEAARRHFSVVAPAPDAASGETGANVSAATNVVVYYAHTTLRCVTCNKIEALAKATVDSGFEEEMAAGRVAWRVVNFQEDEAFARRYDIASSCVVVVGMRGAEDAGFDRLDEVWTKVDDPAAFKDYVAGSVRTFLPAGEEGAP